MKGKYVKVGKKYYSHKSVVRLIECHSDICQNPEKIIRKLAQEKLADAKDIAEAMGISWDGPPFNPKILASILGILCEKSDELTHSEDAELYPVGNGNMVIRYNPKKPKARQNFSIAHEIAHTLFPGYQDQYKARHWSGKFDPENEVEFLCDLGASEFIMPTPIFDMDVKRMGVSLKSLQELSRRYETSIEATSIRMITTSIESCAMMVLSHSYKPEELDKLEREKNQLKLFNGFHWEPPSKKLRVQYFFPTENFSAYIPKYKSIEDSCPIYKVSETRHPYQGPISINISNQHIKFYGEAIILPGTHKRGFGSNVLVFLYQR
ncbi:ImmA/IrrE family metallo-endopeptidase [Candidatus Poribacteria bacterium]|nr:ImmA/IrrE family metallo-endopeptidase [Candidatus Poribacteria bacterium]